MPDNIELQIESLLKRMRITATPLRVPMLSLLREKSRLFPSRRLENLQRSSCVQFPERVENIWHLVKDPSRDLKKGL